MANPSESYLPYGITQCYLPHDTGESALSCRWLLLVIYLYL